MKKITAVISAVLLSISCFLVCGCKDEEAKGANEPTKKYISMFDSYRDCLIIPVTSWMGHLVEEGLIETEWNQEKNVYIREGLGSCRVTTREATTRYKGHIMANSEIVSVKDINGAKLISLDVYNPENITIDVSIDVICGSKAAISVTKSCPAKQWTTISAVIEEKSYDKVKSYVLTLENKVSDSTFTLYLDNFYVEFAE